MKKNEIEDYVKKMKTVEAGIFMTELSSRFPHQFLEHFRNLTIQVSPADVDYILWMIFSMPEDKIFPTSPYHHLGHEECQRVYRNPYGFGRTTVTIRYESDEPKYNSSYEPNDDNPDEKEPEDNPDEKEQ